MMYAAELAERTNRDLSEALSVIKPMPTAPAPVPQGPQPGPGPAGPPLGGQPGGPGNPSPLALKPQSMAMTNISMRPPTQNPIMGGLAQVKGFARGGRVDTSKWACLP